MQQFEFRVFRMARWQMALGIGLFLALLIGLLVLALGVFLLVLPVVVVGGALAYFFGGRRQQPATDGQTIEADYRVIEQEQIDRSKHE